MRRRTLLQATTTMLRMTMKMRWLISGTLSQKSQQGPGNPLSYAAAFHLRKAWEAGHPQAVAGHRTCRLKVIPVRAQA